MNISIEDAGLSDDFSIAYLSNSENIQLVKSKIASIVDEDARVDAFLEFPEALIAAKQWDEAESALDIPKDIAEEFPHAHAHSVVKVASAFLDQGWNERAYHLAKRVLVIAEMIGGSWEEAEVLNEAGSIFFATGDSQRALATRLYAADVAAKDQDADIDCSSVMKSITWDLAKNAEFEAARRVAASIRNRVRRQSAFSRMKTIEAEFCFLDSILKLHPPLMEIMDNRRAQTTKSDWKEMTAAEFSGLSSEEKTIVETSMILARLVRERRGARGWTQKVLADRLGEKLSHIVRLERGEGVSFEAQFAALCHMGAEPRAVAPALMQITLKSEQTALAAEPIEP